MGNYGFGGFICSFISLFIFIFRHIVYLVWMQSCGAAKRHQKLGLDGRRESLVLALQIMMMLVIKLPKPRYVWINTCLYISNSCYPPAHLAYIHL